MRKSCLRIMYSDSKWALFKYIRTFLSLVWMEFYRNGSRNEFYIENLHSEIEIFCNTIAYLLIFAIISPPAKSFFNILNLHLCCSCNDKIQNGRFSRAIELLWMLNGSLSNYCLSHHVYIVHNIQKN